MIILIIIELLCTIPLTILWLKTDANKIDEEFTLGIVAAYTIGTSILNWFWYAAFTISPILKITSGIFEGDLNILGLILAISPPIFSVILSYTIFFIIINIKYIKLTNKKEKE